MTFRVLVDELQMYNDQYLSSPVGYDAPALTRDDVVEGSYVDEDVVHIADPYNVFVQSDRLEPVEDSRYDVSKDSYKQQDYAAGGEDFPAAYDDYDEGPATVGGADFDEAQLDAGSGEVPYEGGDYVDVEDDYGSGPRAVRMTTDVSIPEMDDAMAAEYDQLPAAMHNTILYGAPAQQPAEEGGDLMYAADDRALVVADGPIAEDGPVPEYGYGGYDYDGGYTEEAGVNPVFSVISDPIRPSQNPGSVALFSTGDLLEDCDNIMRLYTPETDDKQRERMFVDFWEKFHEMKKMKPRDHLKIPCKVRGILAVLDELEPYRADEIMRTVLWRNGIRQNPDYFPSRFIMKIFFSYEFLEYFKWFLHNLSSMRAWMFLFSFMLSIAIVMHSVVDFVRGEIWRALLMEFLVPFAAINMVLFMDTPFTACVLRTEIESYSAALASVSGRIFYNLLIVFYCMSSWRIGDTLLLILAAFLGLWSVAMYVVYERFKNTSKFIRLATGNTKHLAKKFAQYDTNYDGVLNAAEIKAFFDSYNQPISNWQIETMIMQYDFLRDGGLRFDALCAWFYKSPLDAETLTQAHANVEQFTDPLEQELDLNMRTEYTEAEKQALADMGLPTGDGGGRQSIQASMITAMT